jgi:serine/threonine-protein kinase PpkA
MSPASVPDEVARDICLSKGWALLGPIGGGSFKRVFRVQDSERNTFALKIVAEMSPRNSREVTALRRCNHPNIARLFSVGRHNHNRTPYDYTLEEFLAGGTLTNRLDGNRLLNDEQVLRLGDSIIGAIIHLTDLGLVHRDIKPDNIMFKEDGVTPVLVDFGLVRDLADVSLTQTWAPRGPGTPN